MSIFEDDGCVRANIRTQNYRVTYAPKCQHTKIRAAQITIQAESAEDALAYCAKWLRLPQMTPATANAVLSATRLSPERDRPDAADRWGEWEIPI
jgi:hypothetical protein